MADTQTNLGDLKVSVQNAATALATGLVAQTTFGNIPAVAGAAPNELPGSPLTLTGSDQFNLGSGTTLTLGASGSYHVYAFTKPTDTDPDGIVAPPAAGSAWLKTELQAAVTGSGGGTIQGLQFGLDASSAVRLLDYRQHAAGDEVAKAVLDTIASARFATEMKSIRALTGGDALAYLVSGKLALQSTFTYADVLAGSVAALDQVLGMTGAAAYKMNVGANLAANFTASDDFRLVFTPGKELEIAVEVQKSASSNAAATASLGVQVGFDNPAQLAGLLDSYLIGRLGTRYEDFKDLLGKLASVSNLTQLDPSQQALAQAIITRLGLTSAQDQVAALNTRLAGAETKLAAALLKVVSTQIKVAFTASYTRVATSQAILRFETSADSLAPLLDQLLLGNLAGVTSRLAAGDPAFLLDEYMESREVQTGRSFGISISIGKWAMGSTFTVTEDRKEQKNLTGVLLSYDGRRALQSSWNKDQELYAFELGAAMDHYAAAPTAQDFAFLLNLSWMWNATLDANLLHAILDLAAVWRVASSQDVAGSHPALVSLLGKRVQAQLELRVSDVGVRQLVLFPEPTFQFAWVQAMAESLPAIFFGDHFLRENVDQRRLLYQGPAKAAFDQHAPAELTAVPAYANPALLPPLSPGDRIQLQNFDFGKGQLGNFAIYGIKALWNPGSATVNPWSLYQRFRSALGSLGGFIGGSGAYADVATAFSGIQSLIAQDYQGRMLGSIVAQLLAGKPGLLSASCQVTPADGGQAVVIAGGAGGGA